MKTFLQRSDPPSPTRFLTAREDIVEGDPGSAEVTAQLEHLVFDRAVGAAPAANLRGQGRVVHLAGGEPPRAGTARLPGADAEGAKLAVHRGFQLAVDAHVAASVRGGGLRRGQPHDDDGREHSDENAHGGDSNHAHVAHLDKSLELVLPRPDLSPSDYCPAFASRTYWAGPRN